MVTSCGKIEHITLVFCDVLYWLPVPQQIQFKIAFLAFNCVQGTSQSGILPACLHTDGESFWPVSDPANVVTWLYWEQQRKLTNIAASVIWNSLPKHKCSPSISKKQFRCGLKIYLFQQAYNLWEHCFKSVSNWTEQTLGSVFVIVNNDTYRSCDNWTWITKIAVYVLFITVPVYHRCSSLTSIQLNITYYSMSITSVLWLCKFGIKSGIHPVKYQLSPKVLLNHKANCLK